MTDDIVDTNFKEAFADIQLQQSLLYEQALIAKELLANQGVIRLPYNPKATVLHFPKSIDRAAFTITLAPEHCQTRHLLFGVFNATAYRYLMTDDFSAARISCLKVCQHVWRYLDTIDLTDVELHPEVIH